MEVPVSLPSTLSSLPDRPRLEKLRALAKERRLAGEFPTLALAQLAVARDHGFASWPKLKAAVETAEWWQAISDGDAARLTALSAKNRKLVDVPNPESGATALHLAAQANDVPLVEFLVSIGATFEAKFGGSAHTALSWALTVHSFDAANRLVELGAEPDLFCAAGLGNLDAVRRFWVGGKLRSAPSRTGSSRYSESGESLKRPPESDEDQVSDALYLAARNGHANVGQFLLEKGADPNWRGYLGGTPLHWAEYAGWEELAAALRSFGGEDTLTDREFYATPAAFSIIVPAAWGIEWLLQQNLTNHPERIDLCGGFGTALNAAAFNGQAGAAGILLSFGADLKILNRMGHSPAQVARLQGYEDLAAMLDRTESEDRSSEPSP
jgi:ankyrin repeat protein